MVSRHRPNDGRGNGTKSWSRVQAPSWQWRLAIPTTSLAEGSRSIINVRMRMHGQIRWHRSHDTGRGRRTDLSFPGPSVAQGVCWWARPSPRRATLHQYNSLWPTPSAIGRPISSIPGVAACLDHSSIQAIERRLACTP